MDSVQDHIKKMREERALREKARLEKLRELNLKKYNKNEVQPRNATSNLSIAMKSARGESIKLQLPINQAGKSNNITRRPLTAPLTNKNDAIKSKPTLNTNKTEIKTIKYTVNGNSVKNVANNTKTETKSNIASKDIQEKSVNKNVTNLPKNHGNTNSILQKPITNVEKKPIMNKRNTMSHNFNSRKSLAVEKPKDMTRKSMIPTQTKVLNNNSVFERLYKPKYTQIPQITEAQKLQSDPKYLEKVIRTSGLILNKRHSVFVPKAQIAMPVRRSISAVHFKRISKQELSSCIHKWASIGDNLNKEHLTNINEDETVKDDRIVSAVKSERKKVKFMTPMAHLNTPRPEELQARLKAWLQKRGKNLDSYHHLQCFGIHHLQPKLFMKPYDDENKENIAVESDSDNDSYTENINEDNDVNGVNGNNDNGVNDVNDKWRRVSSVSSTVDFNDSHNTTLTGSDVISLNTNEVLIGALNDLTELLRDGFEWEQCARWLRAIRERFPSAPQISSYWECRAALEERRGDLPASVQCWEEAIVKGTEHSVVEANLDHLLDKFMQLKISPNSGNKRQADPKLVDVKNVFKSTIIRFAVQQAKLRQSGQFDAPKYTVTPVRRSGRLSAHFSGKRTPLQICTSVRQAEMGLAQKPLFVPNDSLCGTP